MTRLGGWGKVVGGLLGDVIVLCARAQDEWRRGSVGPQERSHQARESKAKGARAPLVAVLEGRGYLEEYAERVGLGQAALPAAEADFRRGGRAARGGAATAGCGHHALQGPTTRSTWERQ